MVVSAVLERALRHPDAAAATTEHGTLSFGRLADRVQAIAGSALLRDGRGTVTALQLADPAELLAAVLAVQLSEGIPLVCDSRWSAGYTRAVLAGLGGVPLINADALAASSPDAAARSPLATPRPLDGVAWASFSSGSTGEPRAIVRSDDSWARSFAPLRDLTGLTEADAMLLPSPLAGSLSMFGAMHALWAGCRVLAPSTDTDAALTVLLAETTVVHTTPTMFLRILDLIDGGVPHRLRLALLGGAALTGTERWRAVGHGIRVVSYYGAAELSFVAIDVDGSGLHPFPGVELRIEPLPGTEVGQVWVRSPYLSDGYLGSARGPFTRGSDGWASVGDLATVPHPGSEARPALELRGRVDGAILTAGATVIPEDVEAVLSALPGIRDAVVFGMPHPRLGAIVCVVVETTDAAGAAERAAWQAACRDRLTTAQQPRRWFATDALARTATGKPARARIVEAATHGTSGVRRLG